MVLRTCATARKCSHILVELFIHDRSHLMEPPLPGVTILILLEYPATINEPSVAPSLEITFLGTSRDDLPFQTSNQGLC